MQFWDWSSEAKAIKTITLRLDEQCESPLLLSRECSLLLKDVGSKPTSQHIIIQRCQEQPGIANHKAADISGASRYHKFIMIKMKKQTNFRSDIQHQARARMLRANAWSMAKSFHSAVSKIRWKKNGIKLSKWSSFEIRYTSLKKRKTKEYFVKSIAETSRLLSTRSDHNIIKTTIQTTLSNPSLYTHKPLWLVKHLQPKPAQLVSIAIMTNKPTPAIKAKCTCSVLVLNRLTHSRTRLCYLKLS